MKPSERQAVLTIAGQSVTVIWKRRNKNVYLRVGADGRACVTAPWAASEDFIRRFVAARADWLQRHQAQRRESLLRHVWQYVEGESFPLLGRPYTLQVQIVPVAEPCHMVHQDATGKLILYVHAGMGQKERAAVVWQACYALLARIVKEQLPLCEAIVGRRASRIDFRHMTSRWGSCNVRTGRICLNLGLVHFPVRATRYIIMHELAHLHEPSHNACFHALMDRFCPDWRSSKKILRDGLFVKFFV